MTQTDCKRKEDGELSATRKSNVVRKLNEEATTFIRCYKFTNLEVTYFGSGLKIHTVTGHPQ